jgi:hypothetical protein
MFNLPQIDRRWGVNEFINATGVWADVVRKRCSADLASVADSPGMQCVKFHMFYAG